MTLFFEIFQECDSNASDNKENICTSLSPEIVKGHPKGYANNKLNQNKNDCKVMRSQLNELKSECNELKEMICNMAKEEEKCSEVTKALIKSANIEIESANANVCEDEGFMSPIKCENPLVVEITNLVEDSSSQSIDENETNNSVKVPSINNETKDTVENDEGTKEILNNKMKARNTVSEDSGVVVVDPEDINDNTNSKDTENNLTIIAPATAQINFDATIEGLSMFYIDKKNFVF